ncbi:MAG: hypothetical protein JWO72_2589 [Caulobacteraceae bacterium]|jgi:hypothetical protein|nr:hypothetical protein [Caulobacteraceae bacterium]
MVTKLSSGDVQGLAELINGVDLADALDAQVELTDAFKIGLEAFIDEAAFRSAAHVVKFLS